MRHLYAALPLLSDLRVLSLAAALVLALVTLVVTGDPTAARPIIATGPRR